MNEFGWFVAGVEFLLLCFAALVTWLAHEWSKVATKKIEDAARRIDRDAREIEELRRQIEELEGIEENQETLFAAATDEENPKFMDVVRLIRKFRQDSEDFAKAKERAARIFTSEPGV